MITAPMLDDRSFEDIFSLAKALIPRYAPEWTNYNESDPGIALLQLYAWMTEMTIFRLNQVPERNYIKFLQLLGIQPMPASCAQAQVVFTLDGKGMVAAKAQTVTIPQGTRVASSAPATDATGATQPPPIFETTRTLIGIEATLAQVMSFDGAGYTSYTIQNSQGQAYYPFGRNVRLGSALLLGFDSQFHDDQSFPNSNIDLLVNIYLDSATGQAANACDPTLTFSQAPVTLSWEFYDGLVWRPMVLVEDQTLALTRSGHIIFTAPGSRAIKTTFPGGPAVPLYLVRARVVSGSYQTPPQLVNILTNAVEVSQSLTVTEETLGGSDGSPCQTFNLDNFPVIAHQVRDTDGSTILVSALELVVDEGDTTLTGSAAIPQLTGGTAASSTSTEILWQEVPDFLHSTRSDRHYTLDRGAGKITFGDGVHGLIPPYNAQNAQGNIIARCYEYGGGSSGNLSAGQINQMQSAVQFVQSVTNPNPSIGGQDPESLDDAKARAQQVIQNRGRAVTVDDFIVIACQTPGANIQRAQALPLVHPRFPGVQVPGVVTVIIVPKSTNLTPTPTVDIINLVCAYLSKYRLLTTEVYVIPPAYRELTITATVIAKPEADLGEVQSDVEQSLETYFDVFKGGDDGAGWGFGDSILYSDIYRQILSIPSVDRIDTSSKLLVYLDGVKQPEFQDVSIAYNELLYTNGHQINVRYQGRS